jgi:DNA polymerase III gamma/tau subunit
VRDIADRLLNISELENITLTEPAAALLARLADGAMRDGVSLLDQVAATAEGSINEDNVYHALGLAGDEAIGDWAEIIAGGNVSAALTTLNEQIDLGRDISSLLGELSQSLRDVLLNKLRGIAVKSTSLSGQTTERVLYMLTTVQTALSQMSRSPQPRTEAELCIIKLCGTQPPAEPEPPPPVTAVTSPSGKGDEKEKEEEQPTPAPMVKEEETTAGCQGEFPNFKSLAADKLPPSLKSFLLNDRVEIEQSESLWKVIAPDDITLSRLSQPSAIKLMEETASDIAGRLISVRVLLKPAPKKNPKLQMLMDNFES